MYIDNYGRIVRPDELYHHGILGMEWGKVNGPPYPLGAGDHSASENRAGWTDSLTPKRKAQMDKELKRINKQQKRRYMQQYDINAITSKENAAKKYEEEHVIPKGTVLYRTSTNPNETRKGGTMYVSYLEPERNLYKGGWVEGFQKSKDSYEYSMKSTVDIKVPSREKLYSTINQVINNNQDLLNKTIESRLRMYGVKAGAMNSDGERYTKKDVDFYINKSFEKYKGMNLNQAAYFAAESFGDNKQLRDNVIKKLKSEGYNAIRDEASVGDQNGTGAQGIDPLILFDDRNVTSTKVSKVGSGDKEKSKSEYLDWQDTRKREIRQRNGLVKSLHSRGYTYSEIADRLAISNSTVQDILS